MMVHGAHSQRHRDRGSVRRRVAVGKDEQSGPVADGGFPTSRQGIQRAGQRLIRDGEHTRQPRGLQLALPAQVRQPPRIEYG